MSIKVVRMIEWFQLREIIGFVNYWIKNVGHPPEWLPYDRIIVVRKR